MQRSLEDSQPQGGAATRARRMVQPDSTFVLDPQGTSGPSVVSYLHPGENKKTTLAAVMVALKVYSSLVCVRNWGKGGDGTWVRIFKEKTVVPMVVRALQNPLDKTLPRTQRHLFLQACVAARERGHPLPSILVDAMTTVLLKEVATNSSLFSRSLTNNSLIEKLSPFLGGFAPTHNANRLGQRLRVRMPDHATMMRLQADINRGQVVSGITGGAAASLHKEFRKETPFQGSVEAYGDIDFSAAVPSHFSNNDTADVLGAYVNKASRDLSDVFGVKVSDIIHIDDGHRRTADYNAHAPRINGRSSMHIVTLTLKIRQRLANGRKNCIDVPLAPLQIIVYRQNPISRVFDPMHPQKNYDLAHCELRQYTYI